MSKTFETNAQKALTMASGIKKHISESRLKAWTHLNVCQGRGIVKRVTVPYLQ